ncbi:SDR family oxidoreductase [Methylobacterium brachythecii]|uniref:NAD(P)-dependent dehydrogenase (Short-subunit alcohol dehydrogenase family) n=1 Tax=Methylobacterium brachythecii TaxID=1176177 RepID=A0A7W6F801_9HYPH|nr:SDR family oxidoreductase [Methylobacterium brachythecii]MBB3903666.1 NAD(P)-dependent dehydrogenase (short-subunit alcohol dehydrogenase family) [Methylobacterium brachythecii]GLS44237.1 oxidoreductase [Methylobacterium brachythecii]
MKRLEGKIAVVTGGSSGMGRATAKQFVAEGATVITTGRRQDRLDETVAEIGGSIEGFVSDIADLGDLERLRAHIADRHGRIDVIFANAGGGTLGAFGTISEADFDRSVTTNLKGTFFTVQTLLPLVVDGGSIILNGSIAASLGMPAFTVYSATKAAIRSFARTWTTDLSARRIRVNTLAPGTILTPILSEQAGLSDEQVEGFLEKFAAETPLGRNGDPSEIASVATFLASSESSFITGIELQVDGGYAQV